MWLCDRRQPWHDQLLRLRANDPGADQHASRRAGDRCGCATAVAPESDPISDPLYRNWRVGEWSALASDLSYRPADRRYSHAQRPQEANSAFAGAMSNQGASPMKLAARESIIRGADDAATCLNGVRLGLEG